MSKRTSPIKSAPPDRSRELYRVALRGGRVLLPCSSRAGAESYARTWNGLSPDGLDPRAEVQPLEPELIDRLFGVGPGLAVVG